MDYLRALHNEAMDFAQMGQIATRQGDCKKAELMFHQAFAKEREAAMIAYKNQHPQPWLSILLQSAAHLAATTSQPREAEKLIGLALSGDVPSDIRNDLRQLLVSLNVPANEVYDTYAIQIPAGDSSILNALSTMLNRLGCSMKKIAAL